MLAPFVAPIVLVGCSDAKLSRREATASQSQALISGVPDTTYAGVGNYGCGAVLVGRRHAHPSRA